jgi:peptidoglycan/xylan/chitin deacetylase (PgdA/CDA1 family)
MSNIKSSLKLAAVHSLHAVGLSRLTAPSLGVVGTILTFHEIHDDFDTELRTGCPVSFLEASIRWLRHTGWDIVTLDDALVRLRNGEEKRRFAVITFDDGYRDNITRALPILRRERVPFTIYVPTAAITRELYAWWLGLRELFRTNNEVDLPCLNMRFSCVDLAGKRRGLAVAMRWAHDNFNRVSDLRYSFSQYQISLRALCDRYFMNEGELNSLSAEPLATIGAHTVTHPALATLESTEVARELADNRAYLQTRLDREIKHFAYPYGSPAACGEREIRLASQAGFKSAVTTSHRPLFMRDGLHLHKLPRLNMYPHSTIAHLDTGTGGLTRTTVRSFLSSRSGRLRTFVE